MRNLELSCDSAEDADSWKASFLRAGVYPEKDRPRTEEKETKENSDDFGIADPLLERQVETIRSLVESYIKIINKTIRDFIPKVIMHMVINNLSNFIKKELIANIYLFDQTALMKESEEEVLKQRETLRIYNTTKEALKIISDVTRDTLQEMPEHKTQFNTQPSYNQPSLYPSLNRSFDSFSSSPRAPPRPPPATPMAKSTSYFQLPNSNNQPQNQLNFYPQNNQFASANTAFRMPQQATNNYQAYSNTNGNQQNQNNSFQFTIDPAKIAGTVSTAKTIFNNLENANRNMAAKPAIPKRSGSIF